MLSQVGRGMKRPLLSMELTDATSQRQSILDMSMCKLQTQPVRKVEPSLRRSVLIFNTLKHIEQELKDEGVRVYPPSRTTLIPLVQSDDSEMEVAPPFFEQSDVSNSHHSGIVNSVSLLKTTRCDMCYNEEDSLSSASNNLVATQYMDISDPSPAILTETMTLTPPSNLTSVPDQAVESLSYKDYLSCYTHVATNCQPVPTFEEMLNDLDLTVYDMDLLTVNSSASKLNSVSGEDLDLFAPLSVPINCKSELMFEDLDSLFQHVFVTS